MNGYLKPLRRKIGVLTLVMACVFAAGWVRSIQTCDSVPFDFGRNYMAASLNGRMHWKTIGLPFDGFPIQFGRISSFTTATSDPQALREAYTIREIGAVFNAMKSGQPENQNIDCPEWAIPYWSIVLPLTLLSAWLLLSKRRQPKLAKTAV